MIIEELQARGLKKGILIVDDTISYKTGKHREGVNIHYDHSDAFWGISSSQATL